MTQKTTVDWFRVRTQAEVRDGLEALRPLFGDLGHHLTLVPCRGQLGFQQGCNLLLADMTVGRCDFGGESQRGWVRWDMPGKGCEWVKDWAAAEAVESLPGAEIRRLDLALTTWRGEVSHAQVVEAHAAGLFSSGGRPPNLQQIINSDPRAGRTCNIGTREKSDKFMRCYEKGLQLAAQHPIGLEVTHIDGFDVRDIYRSELELKAANRPIPWEVIERRDQYFAGAYPFCAVILPGVDADILQRRPERAPQRELAIALENCRIQYGRTLYTALHAHGGDLTAVWDQIVGTAHNLDLLDAGVLLVDH